MSLGLRLELKQSQQLVMTPQLQQAIRLLQMSNVELCAYVASEVERNPLLEFDDFEPAPAPAQAKEEVTLDQKVTAEGDLTLPAETFDTGSENLADDPPIDRPGPAPSDGWACVGAGGRLGFDGEAQDMADRLSQPESLRDHLLAQIGQSRAPHQIRLIAQLIIEELDEAGYYRGDLQAVADRLGVALTEAEAGLDLVQSCEPTGVGARDLADCLRLQLEERGPLDAATARMLDALPLFTEGRPDALCRATGLTPAEIGTKLAALRCLDPRPGAGFLPEIAETLIPDVFLTRPSWGGWHVELNPDTLPRLLVDQRYALTVGSGGPEAENFVAECQATANWLIKSLDQRARTILKVAGEIVRCQEAFFEGGVARLKPLTLKMVADAVSIHESTASRVTSNKFISTERGIFELKFFFTNSVGSDDTVSAEAVRHRIKAMIDGEPPNDILSDDAIVEILQRDGIDVARRTVAKYRKGLKIPSSVERRRAKALAAAF
ncbi:MAG: RNA polymerase factor sigma-54 [Pseudomonadota bacterium]